MSAQPVSPPTGMSAGASTDVRFGALFDQAPVSIQLFSPEGRTLRVNKAWEELWQIREGSALKELVFSADYNLLTDPQLVSAGIAAYLARACGGESVDIPVVRYDVAALGGSGPARWVTARAHPIKDADGKVLEVMLIHEDITDSVQAETALKAREERFRSLVMATSQTVWTTTADGRVIDDSPSWRALTGQTYDEWKEFGWLDALHPDDREATGALWSACVAACSLFETRYRIRCASGGYRWVAVKGLPILDAEGAVREWIGANTDIHDMVMAQAELAERLERERRNSALLARVAHASRIVHTALSSKQIADALVGEVREILHAHQALVSLTKGENSFQAIDAVSMSDQFAHFHSAEPLRGTLSVPLIDRTGKEIGLIRVTDKAEGEFSAEDEAVLIQLASIAANGFENARLYWSLQEEDRRKDEFLAMLAHELRNPLAPISAAAEMLKLGGADAERVQRASAVISRQVRHMTALVDDLLDVARVTRGLIQLDSAPVAVADIVASAIEQARPLLEACGHSFSIAAEGEGKAAQVFGDRHRLVQVLVNLLNNAAKYTPRGGQIGLTVARQGAAIAITVRDNGIGLDENLLPHVFELFTQGERSPDRAQGGLGIGLALVRHIMTMHGGEVAVHSDGPGTGSSFTVTLATMATPGAA